MQMTPLELNDVHQSSGRVLQNQDSIEGPKEKEDSKDEIKEPWAALDGEKRS